MPRVEEIRAFLDELAPQALAEDWDNVGALVDCGSNVTSVMMALDITDEVVTEAEMAGCQLIVSHHPVIFHPVRTITDGDPTGQILLELAERGVAAICAHTNLDAAQGGVNDCLAQTLELTQIEQLHQDGVDREGRPYGIGRVGLAHCPGLTAGEYAAFVKEKLGAASVRFADGGRPVHRVAVGGGSCGSMVADALAAGCDTFVTADVKYDQYLQAKAQGLTLMDAGHFATENVVCAPLARWLSDRFPGVEAALSQRHREVYQGV